MKPTIIGTVTFAAYIAFSLWFVFIRTPDTGDGAIVFLVGPIFLIAGWLAVGVFLAAVAGSTGRLIGRIFGGD